MSRTTRSTSSLRLDFFSMARLYRATILSLASDSSSSGGRSSHPWYLAMSPSAATRSLGAAVLSLAIPRRLVRRSSRESPSRAPSKRSTLSDGASSSSGVGGGGTTFPDNWWMDARCLSAPRPRESLTSWQRRHLYLDPETRSKCLAHHRYTLGMGVDHL